MESPSYGLRDGEREPDGYAIFSWVHTFNANSLLTVSPFYHYNSADYQGGPNDYPGDLHCATKLPITAACRQRLTSTSGETT